MPSDLAMGLGAGSHIPTDGERHKHTQASLARYGDNTESSHVLWTFHLQTAQEGEVETELFPSPVD